MNKPSRNERMRDVELSQHSTECGAPRCGPCLVAGRKISRRAVLSAAASIVAMPVVAQECLVGPPPHHKGPLVFMDYDQLELDASYDQVYYEPLISQVSKRLTSNSEAMRARIGTPQRIAYGPTEIEKLDVYRANRAKAPIFVFIH